MSDIIVATKWEVINNPIRNTNQEYLKFINSAVFSEEARFFLKNGYYTNAPSGTFDYVEYWNIQEKRCMEGYTVGGVRVTGRHYFYLNFCQIKARPIDPNTGREKKNAKKIITFPRFLDHNFYFFHELEECFAEGPFEGQPMHNMVALKSRRKGFTYQITGGVYNYNYQFVPASMSVLAAYQKLHYKVTLDGIHFSINHINRSTDWAKRRAVLGKRDHFRSSYWEKNDLGILVEEGYMSEIQAVSFKDDPFKSIGESNYFIGYEESGKFNELLTAQSISEPTLRDGDIPTGVAIYWGTGGDMEKGSTDLAEIFYNPEAYGCKSYENIYDENAVGDCGWFIDDMWYYPGSIIKKHFVNKKEVSEELYFVDEQGNSYRDLAEDALDAKRVIKRKGSRHAFQKFITQQPKTPKESLLRTESNRFDAVRAQGRLADIQVNKSKYIDSIWIGRLEYDLQSKQLKFQYNEKDIPLREFPIKDNNKAGAIEIFEHPVKGADDKIVYGRYLVGIDTYDDDYSTTSSVGSCIVLDSYTDRIVCHYKGRPEAYKFYENCFRVIKYYGAIANYERNKKGLYGYFLNKRVINYLCDEPEILKEQGISKANTLGNNRKGTIGSTPVNAYGLQLYAKWLESPAYDGENIKNEDEETMEILNIDKLRSIGILKETIAWNPDDNFDDISAMGMLMILREDRLKQIKSSENKSSGIQNSEFWGNVKVKRLERQLKHGRNNFLLSSAKAKYSQENQRMA